mgnify:FL=1
MKIESVLQQIMALASEVFEKIKKSKEKNIFF